MRRRIPAGVLIALALLVPAAPAAAQAESTGLDAACQTVERKVYKDIRELYTINVDTATDQEVRVLTAQLLHFAKTDALPDLPDAITTQLNDPSADLRAFVKTDVQRIWSTDLRVTVNQTFTDAGPNVEEAAQKVLGQSSVDVYLAYLNNGLYEARALDCASQPTPTSTTRPTQTPSATTTVVPTPSVSLAAPGGGGGGLPVTGADTATVASIGGALLVLGGAGYLIGRRRRSRFVA
ncbi:LPXTG cell wall anchor domain-containing protein [Micromonospora lupini]|uniref:LPXTG cell wall anchor domain-containing protein n=1 Tax=Micromonospora lupini TaxID=285679 RepID=UPI0022529371|nr:LPXTG cell wall anchor domain-containing protein [Micromonospora lupini]MCX5068391.1 LPXTG cell wall anchor domain-containing protein [Micromonospora lupini]